MKFHYLLISLLCIFRIIIGVILITHIPPNLTELDVYKRAHMLYRGETKFDLYYALYPYIISPLTSFGESGLILSRILSLIFGTSVIIISFVITKNIFLPILISLQPMNIVTSALSKPEIFVFSFTLLSYICLTKYRETKNLRYIYVGALLSSCCIVFKYYVSTLLAYLICSLILLRKENKKTIATLFLYHLIPFLAFLPSIIYYNKDIFRVVMGYYSSYKPPNLHTYHVPLEGEKNIGSVILSLTSSFFALTPYSLLVFFVALVSSVGRNFLISNLFLWTCFLPIYVLWPYFRFLHHYYPITASSVVTLSEGLKKSRYIFLVFVFFMIIALSKRKDYNFFWINEFAKMLKGNERALFLIPLSHGELEAKFKEKYKQKFEFMIYDFPPDPLQNKKIVQKVERGNYRFIFLDTIHLYIKDAVEEKKENLNRIKYMLPELGFIPKGKFDSFEALKMRLDPFERLMFPLFRNLLYQFTIEIYERDKLPQTQ